MQAKQTIKARDLVADLRSGATDFELIEKYDISMHDLDQVLTRLADAGAIRKAELLERSGHYGDPDNKRRTRKHGRELLTFKLEVQDVKDPARHAIIRDISEWGLRIAGLEVSAGEERDLLILADVVSTLEPILVRAECRWNKIRGKTKKYPVAGFEITDISDIGREMLRKLVRVVALVQEGISPSRLGLRTTLFQ
jgi:hypothetical protein